ncbi:hypothetical protein M885DRAFT_626993 [Pelagophyceae sp. CCMP2097]|nr:hypothetical protein M885DRAFT_626993 [Pelagophyceae sp. CCMP2097]
MRFKFLTVVAAVARAAFLAPHDDDATARCLLEGACDAAAACPTAPAFTRKCLDARVPFRTPYAAVRCCLRCCLRHWLVAYGLDENWAHFFAHAAGGARPGGARPGGARPGGARPGGARPGGRPRAGVAPRMDEMLLGYGAFGTLGFAARRLSDQQMQWRQHLTRNDSREMRGGAAGARDGAAADRAASVAAIWAAKRTSAQDVAGLGAWRASDSWIELSFGDSCGGFGGGASPVGLYRELTLTTLSSGFLPGVVSKNKRNPKAVLVTSTDCDLPRYEAENRKLHLADARRLLDSPHLEAWYHTNPSDHVSAGHPKLHASPIGILHRDEWVSALDGREAAEDQRLVACCCMASSPPVDRSDLYASHEHDPNLRVPAFYKMLKAGPGRDAFLEAKAIEPASLDRIYRFGGSWHGVVLCRVRRFAILEALGRNGLKCSHGIVGAEDARARLLSAHFVVSPQGKVRACHREWEALAAGAIPLVDWDASPAMAKLYEGLPVVRVRDWRNVTETFLRARLEEIRAANERGTIDLSKVYLPHWIARFTEHKSG